MRHSTEEGSYRTVPRESFTAPAEPEDRPTRRPGDEDRAPKTPEEWSAALDEWRRNDEELRVWRDAEARARTFGGGTTS